MKKTFVFLLLSFAAFTIQAQVNFGVKAGANYTNFVGSDADGSKFLFGYAGGGLVNFKLADAVSVQAEALYSLEGAASSGDESSVKMRMGYINIPVLAQYNHSSGFYAETGPQLGILANAKGSMEVDGRDVSVDVKDQFKNINFSWGIGAGYKLSNGLGIGARYNMGLINIPDVPGVDAKVKLSGFHLGLSYTFGSSN